MPGKLLALLLTLSFCLPLQGCDKPPLPRKNKKIAIVHTGNRLAPYLKTFLQRMDALDYRDGINTTYLYDGPVAPDRLVPLLTFLRTQDLDLLYTISSPVTQKAQEIFAGSGVPIVFGPVFSPLSEGMTTSLSHPDQNMTGVMIRGNIPKAFGLLQETMPSLKKIAVPLPVNETAARISAADLQESAEKSGVTVSLVEIRTMEDLDNFLQHLPTESDLIWLPHSPTIMNNQMKITYRALAQKIPVASAAPQFDSGLLLCYGPKLETIGDQVARLADMILCGVPVQELPIEQSEYQLAIDLDVAEQTGHAIPDNVLAQATIIHTRRYRPAPD